MSQAAATEVRQPRRLGLRLPRRHAAVGRGQTPRRVDPRAGRIPLAAADRAGGRLRHGRRRHLARPAALRGHGGRSFADRHRTGAAAGRAAGRLAPLRVGRRLRVRPVGRPVRFRLRRGHVSRRPPGGPGAVPGHAVARHPARLPLSVSGRCAPCRSRPRTARRKSARTKSAASWAGSSSSSICGRPAWKARTPTRATRPGPASCAGRRWPCRRRLRSPIRRNCSSIGDGSRLLQRAYVRHFNSIFSPCLGWL